ncbi:hypothetical protein H0H93_007197 [Arthromyces matolae]|nr:hypothetical protein H0H93_007197 [Arthromyces matolae]
MSSPRNGGKGQRMTANSLLAAEYIDELHIQAFANALIGDEFYYDNQDVPSPTLPGTPATATSSQTRIHKVSALSDFAPVNIKVKRRRKKERSHDKRSDWLFSLLRWPLLCFIMVFIAAEFGFYVVIRQLVNTKEWFTAWRGTKGVLRKNLRAARTYQEWKEAAAVLDQFLNFDQWKTIDEDQFYDWRLVKKVKKSLKSLRDQKDARGCLGVLETCIRSNFAGVESSRLYSETFWGTKVLIESYFTELEKTLEFVRETPDLSMDEKKRFFKSANTNLGISALCLSGGASFGYYHVGVVKAFLDTNLLPRVVTGTSAGGLIAALVCTRTDDELTHLLVPELANRITACEEPFTVWFKRLRATGARFDSVSPTKLLNYLTAPDTLIWTALLASAAVPGILNPVVLLQKLKDGSVVPWNWGSKFKDGSVDIPLQALNLYFNVTNPVVSQVNPHVHLFFFAPRGSAGKPVAHRKGKGWRGNFLLSAAEQWLKHELAKNFKVIRDLELLPQLLGQDWSTVFLQRFEGAVTGMNIEGLVPVTERSGSSRARKDDASRRLHMIENRAKIEKQIYLGRQYVRKSLRGRSFTPEQAPLAPSSPNDVLPNSRITSISIDRSPSSDPPMSADTDAETAFHRKSHWFFKRGRDYEPIPPTSGAATPGEVPEVAVLRRKRPDTLPSVQDTSIVSPPTSSPPHAKPIPGSSLLSRLRERSFTNFTVESSPNSSKHSTDIAEHWSSDSSSEDDLTIEDRRQLRYPTSTHNSHSGNV